MSPDPNFGFIIAAYALALLMVAGMIGVIAMDYARLKRQLSSLDSQQQRRGPRHPVSLEAPPQEPGSLD
jgi:heme exporter protein CcmD